MLICTSDIDPIKFIEYREQLREALKLPEITKSISPYAQMDAFSTSWESPCVPSCATKTFFSIDGDELLGMCQFQKTTYQDGFIHCTETLAYNFSKKNIIYGRDYREFYEYLNENVHKVNMSIMGNFSEEDFQKPYGKPFEALLRHLKPYGGRYVGKFEKHTTNALGEIVDVHMVEFITKKGKEEFYNKPQKSC